MFRNKLIIVKITKLCAARYAHTNTPPYVRKSMRTNKKNFFNKLNEFLFLIRISIFSAENFADEFKVINRFTNNLLFVYLCSRKYIFSLYSKDLFYPFLIFLAKENYLSEFLNSFNFFLKNDKREH